VILEDAMFPFVVDRLNGSTATSSMSTLSKEDDRAHEVKRQIDMGGIEFITVSNRYFQY
jgi:hypothetical protein